MVQLSTRCPFSLVLESTSLPNSGYYNKNDATEGYLPKCPHLSKITPQKYKKCLPFLESLLNTGYSQICLPPVLFSRSPKCKTHFPEEKSMAKAVSPPGSSPLRVQLPPAEALQTGPPFLTSRLLPSSETHSSCEPSQGSGGHLHPPQPTLGNSKSLLSTDTPSAQCSRAAALPQFPWRELFASASNKRGGGLLRGSLWTAWQVWEGFGFSRGSQTMQLFFRCKNTQKSQTSCFAQRPRQRGSVCLQGSSYPSTLGRGWA